MDNVSAFPFNSAGERPRGAGSFVVNRRKRDDNVYICDDPKAAALLFRPEDDEDRCKRKAKALLIFHTERFMNEWIASFFPFSR